MHVVFKAFAIFAVSSATVGVANNGRPSSPVPGPAAITTSAFRTGPSPTQPHSANAGLRPPSSPATTRWIRPVPGRIVRAFVAPSSPFGPGHRGVDLAVTAGEAVKVVGAGIVVFAGTVAGTQHVVVLHQPSGWKSGYSFLSQISVVVGQRLQTGDVVGLAGSGAGHSVSPIVHISLRIDGEYVDPTVLWAGLDLGRLLHLDRVALE